MVGNSKIDEGAKFEKWREIKLAVAINTIRQKERNKINLNVLNYFKRYLHRDLVKNNGSKLFLK